MAHFYQIPNVKSYVVLHSNRTQPQNLRSAKKKMAPLKSLEQVCALIDSNFQTFCASHGIFTGTFFFFPFDFDSIFNIKLHHFDFAASGGFPHPWPIRFSCFCRATACIREIEAGENLPYSFHFSCLSFTVLNFFISCMTVTGDYPNPFNYWCCWATTMDERSGAFGRCWRKQACSVHWFWRVFSQTFWGKITHPFT